MFWIQGKRLSAYDEAKSLVKKLLGAVRISRCLMGLVPEARIELARTQGPLDFESSASTNFTTPALSRYWIIWRRGLRCQYDIDTSPACCYYF